MLKTVVLATVCKAWSKPVRSNNMATITSRKFKFLRHELKSWSKGISKLSIAIENSNRALFEFDELENKRHLTIPETNFRRILKKHVLRLLAYQKEYWRRRCTIRWVKFGDELPKIFQAMASERFRRNNIASLTTDDGICVEDYSGKEAVIFQTSKKRLGSSAKHEMKFDLARIIKRVEDLDQLTMPFTHQEIDDVENICLQKEI